LVGMDGVGKVHDLDEYVVMAFDVQMWCVLCAWFNLDALLLCNNVVQCFLFCGSCPLPLPLHVPLLCLIGVGNVVVD
jgi:hypothetical protein